MRISIAMCTYNGARYLEKQLESIAGQTCPPWEMIACDDGSTDGTLAMLEGFAGRVKFPVRIFRNERNLGSTKNFEKAIGICEGDLIALSDQDDEWHGDKLGRMHRLFEGLPEALAAFSDAEIVDDDSALVGRRLWKTLNFSPVKDVAHVDRQIVSSLLKLDYIATGATMVFRRGFRGEFMPIPAGWPHDAWIAWIAAVRGGLAPLPDATIRYRVHGEQQIGVAPASRAQRVAIARKNGVHFRLIAERLKSLQEYLQRRRDDPQLAKFIPELDDKIRHLENRASLTASLLRRMGWILSSWKNYQRYSRGPIAMVSDALIVAPEKAAAAKAGRN